MSQLEVKISTAAKLQALQELESGLEKAIVKAQALGKTSEEIGKLETKLTGARDRIAAIGPGPRLGAEVTNLIRDVPVIGRLATALNGAGTAFTGLAGIALAAIPVIKSANAAWGNFEQQANAAAAALANQNQLTQANLQGLVDLADGIEDATGIADAKWLPALTTVIKIGQASVAQMGEHAAAVKNLAGLLGGDIQTAAMLYARALQGHTEMLGRYGIAVDATASKEEQLIQLHQQLARGAGILEAQNSGLTRVNNGLKNSWDDLLKNLGARMSGVTTGIGAELKTIVDYWADFIGKAKAPMADMANRFDPVAAATDKLIELLEAAGIEVDNLDAKTLGDLANAADSLKTKFGQVADELARARQEKDQLAEAETAGKLASLDLEEQQALAAAPPDQQAIIRGQFNVRRQRIRSQAEEQAAQRQVEEIGRQREAAEDQLTAAPKLRADAAAQAAQATAGREQFEQEIGGEAALARQRSAARRRIFALQEALTEAYTPISLDRPRSKEELDRVDRVKTEAPTQIKTAEAEIAAVAEKQRKLRELQARELAAKNAQTAANEQAAKIEEQFGKELHAANVTLIVASQKLAAARDAAAAAELGGTRELGTAIAKAASEAGDKQHKEMVETERKAREDRAALIEKEAGDKNLPLSEREAKLREAAKLREQNLLEANATADALKLFWLDLRDKINQLREADNREEIATSKERIGALQHTLETYTGRNPEERGRLQSQITSEQARLKTLEGGAGPGSPAPAEARPRAPTASAPARGASAAAAAADRAGRAVEHGTDQMVTALGAMATTLETREARMLAAIRATQARLSNLEGRSKEQLNP